ncbi:MAG: hypothetical protein OXD44_07965 [Gammaproteobacteria bacterium]|nr:hypothetical protein [Gammaproteobacteria bacterium]MCY4226521.1 hypothetical protein [Gammaproteobacteria bacterium]MCY4313611.1 hypothetical protein [Gammaproteobacteria bacterium]
MRKLKKLKVKHQETKRRIQFAMHAGTAFDQVQTAQTVIPELDRHQYERFFDDEDSSEGTTSELS